MLIPPPNDVLITHTIPAQFSYILGSITGIGNNDTGNPNLVWTIPAALFISGDQFILTFQIQAISSGLYSTTFVANYGTPTSEISLQKNINVLPATPTYSLITRNPGSIDIDIGSETSTVQICFMNTSIFNSILPITVTATLDALISYVPGSITGTGSNDSNPNILEWVLPALNLEAGENEILTFIVDGVTTGTSINANGGGKMILLPLILPKHPLPKSLL